MHYRKKNPGYTILYLFLMIPCIAVNPANAVSCEDLDSIDTYISYYDAPRLCADLPLLDERSFVKVMIGVQCLRLPSTETIPPDSDTIARARWIDSAYSEWWPRNRDTCMAHTDSILKKFDIRDYNDTAVHLDSIAYATEFPCQVRIRDLPALTRYHFAGTFSFVYTVTTPAAERSKSAASVQFGRGTMGRQYVTPAGRAVQSGGRGMSVRAGGCVVAKETAPGGRIAARTRIDF